MIKGGVAANEEEECNEEECTPAESTTALSHTMVATQHLNWLSILLIFPWHSSGNLEREREKSLKINFNFTNLKIMREIYKPRERNKSFIPIQIHHKFTNLILDRAFITQVKKDFYEATKNITNLPYFMYPY